MAEGPLLVFPKGKVWFYLIGIPVFLEVRMTSSRVNVHLNAFECIFSRHLGVETSTRRLFRRSRLLIVFTKFYFQLQRDDKKFQLKVFKFSTQVFMNKI